jgi:hypothetical protein
VQNRPEKEIHLDLKRKVADLQNRLALRLPSIIAAVIISTPLAMNGKSRYTTNSRSRNAFLPRLARLTSEVLRTLFFISAGAFESQARYWQALPMRSMAGMLFGMFCTYGALGFFLDLIGWECLQEWAVVVFAALLGLSAPVLFVIVQRRRFKLLPLGPALVLAAVLMVKWLPRASQISIPLEARHRIAFDAIGILVATLLGLRFFIRFMSTQGVEQTRARTKLELAHGIQQTLVPPIRFSSDAIEVYGVSVPSEDVGGDLVDLIPTDSGWLACVADVSGHGIPAGVLMGNLKTALRLGCAQGQPLPRVIEAVNRGLPAVKNPEMYATLACLLFKEAGDVDYLVAGHPPILHYRAATAKMERCTMQQFPLGLMPPSLYESASVHYDPGDLFVLLSDGVLETADSAGVEFGLDGVERVLHKHGKLPYEAVNLALRLRPP